VSAAQLGVMLVSQQNRDPSFLLCLTRASVTVCYAPAQHKPIIDLPIAMPLLLVIGGWLYGRLGTVRDAQLVMRTRRIHRIYSDGHFNEQR
jgi:hypothetical protein